MSRDESTVVTTTWTRGDPHGIIVGSLLRLWTIASNRVEDHAVGPTGFFTVVPWPDDRFALIRQPIDGPDAPEADALVAQGRLPRVSIRGFEDPLTDIALARITSDDRLELEGDSSAWGVRTSLLPLGFPLVLRLEGGDVKLHRIDVVPRSPDWGDGDDTGSPRCQMAGRFSCHTLDMETKCSSLMLWGTPSSLEQFSAG